jgi:PAS domain S-box-containing protein
MTLALHPPGEADRLRTLRRLAVLNGTPHRDLDEAVTLTSTALGLSAALTLLDEDQQWVVARAGLGVQETPRWNAFCDHAVGSHDVLVVTDALADERFRDDASVRGDLGLRAYAGVPLRTRTGQQVGALCVFDVAPRAFTEHELTLLRMLGRQTERLLQGRETALQHAAASLAGDLATFQVDGQGELIFSSPGLLTLCGARDPDALPRDLPTLFPDLVAEDIVGRLRVRGDTRRRHTTRLQRLDGQARTVELTARSLRGANGVLLGALGLVRDVTEERRQEAEERHHQKLEALGRLSAGLAHEINTPIQFVGDNTRFLAEAYEAMLNLVKTYRSVLTGESGELPWAERKVLLEQAEQDADIDFLTSEVPSAVEQSLEGIERVASLVRAMKEFSYKDAGEFAPTDLNRLLTTTSTVARNEIKYTAEIELDFADVPPVAGSRSDLSQVFLNLLINAADAIATSGRRGRIVVATRDVGGARVEVSIADDGPGIPEALRERIFEPFFTTKEVGKGTGQGLPLARSVVERHGGSLRLACPPEGGTVFTITLPAVEVAPDPAQEEAS